MGGAASSQPPRQQEAAERARSSPAPTAPPYFPPNAIYPHNAAAARQFERIQPTPSAPPQLTTSWPVHPELLPRPTPQLPAPSGRNHAGASDDGVRACCKFRLRDLSVATQGFSSANVIGEGGFGKVYRGTLLDGTEVAVKRLDPLSLQGDREYYAEIALLTRLRHPNLVCIMGMCNEEGHKLGVFEFMARGSLRDLLDRQELTWKDRISISIGISRGLAYLHEISEPPVIHCDFKSPNVLIDIHGQAHVADFGLARFIGGARPVLNGARAPSSQPSDVTTVTSIRGTYGYLSPEYLEQGHASVRADVFAFGVVLLEIMTGQQAVDATRGRGSESLSDWARPHLREPQRMQAMLDPCVVSQASALQVAVLCEIAEACLRPNPRERPSMLEVIRTLSAAYTHSEQQQPTAQRAQSPAPAPAPAPATAPAQPQEARASPYREAQAPAQRIALEEDAPSSRPPHRLPPPLGVAQAGSQLPGWSMSSPVGLARAAEQGRGAASPAGGSPAGVRELERHLMPVESIQCQERSAEDPLPVPCVRPVRSAEGGRAVDMEGLRLEQREGGAWSRASPSPQQQQGSRASPSPQGLGLSEALSSVSLAAGAGPLGGQGLRPSEPGQGPRPQGAGVSRMMQVSNPGVGPAPSSNFPKLSIFGMQPP